eukprot:GFUD01002931.1.p1 GENE.GFUD01002931.1~~GFUD01002931.1.p1  ORF type:complete len:158 (+),score=31.98 GFUD01002931.1:124-597(+)
MPYCSESTAIHCPQCGKMFDHPSGNKKHIKNMLTQHLQVHQPKTVSCPVCGETRFRSNTNAVQHVESGSCSGCKGKENARQQIHNFIASKKESRGLLANTPALEWAGAGTGRVPDLPYKCQECSKKFRQVSALMQHQQYGNCGARGPPAITFSSRRY